MDVDFAHEDSQIPPASAQICVRRGHGRGRLVDVDVPWTKKPCKRGRPVDAPWTWTPRGRGRPADADTSAARLGRGRFRYFAFSGDIPA